MAIVKTLIVKGVARFLTDAYMSTIRSGIWNGSTIQVGYGGTGVTSAKGNLYTPVFLSSSGIAACSVEIPHNTKNFKINNTTFPVYTTYTGNVNPTFWAPTELAGTGGYILATNAAKNGLEWVAKPATNVTTSAVVSSSASGTTLITAAQANPYYNLLEGGAVSRSIRFVAGNGITISAATDGQITITNSKPDADHNTDRTGVKLGTVSGTKKTDSTLIIATSTTGLTIAGGTNKFSIGDGTNYIEVPVTPSFTVSNKAATIGTSLTTLATIAGVDITAKIPSVSTLASQIYSGAQTLTVSTWTTIKDISTYDEGTYALSINASDLYASGVFSICKGTDVMADEIVLHVSNKTSGATWRPYARISGKNLELSCNEATGTSRTYTVKILKLI